MKSTQLYKRLIGEENIYMAIYSVHSYISNIELLDEEDINNLNELKDKYDEENILKIIKAVQNKIEELITDKQRFITTKVYFRPKKYNEESDEIEFRPLHTTSLINHITIVAMLNILIYENKSICYGCNNKSTDKNNDECKRKDNNECEKLVLSSLSRLMPSNFYGNRISIKPEILYKDWTKQYKRYTGKANELFAKYYKTKEYKYEVNLDLKNFFPSINPELLFNYILEKLPVFMKSKELELIKIILIKLLFLKLDKNILNNYNTSLYYQGKEKNIKNDYFVKGIPQGLPQSYFFANILMIEIASKFNKVFKGESLFYVDDSIIFTNDINGTPEGFQEKIEELNKEISEINKKYYIKESYIKDNYNFLSKFTNDMDYEISVHDQLGKSNFTNILNPNLGEIYLENITREVSKTSFDLNTNFSDEEDIILKNRLIILEKQIDEEINGLTNKIRHNKEEKQDLQQIESYHEKLIRYKKYFKLRKMILKYRECNNYNEILNDNINKLNDLINLEDKDFIKQFFNLYNEDILEAKISFIFKNNNLKNQENNKNLEEVSQLLILINNKLFDYNNKKINHNNLISDTYIINEYKYTYIYKLNNYNRWKKENKINENIDSYRTLRKNVKEYMPKFKDMHKKIKYKYLSDIIEKIDENFKVKKEILSPNFCKIISLVDFNTDEIKRKILNCIFSYIFNIKINDSYSFFKKDNRLIKYKELRMLVYIRNNNFILKDFVDKVNKFENIENDTDIDYNILAVLEKFRTFVKDPNKIDDLIIIHKYTCDVWRNGSKYLYFYTLHNQEHAVDLIKNSIKIVKSIDFLQITKLDYYILFLACYLHDISMVTLPELDEFQSNNTKTNKIYSDFIKDIKNININNSRDIKIILTKYYRELDLYYENLVRSNHAKDSGQEIRSRKELNIIETCLKDIVAEVAEAHGHDAIEVYKSKSMASQRLVSKKYLQIILRIADLLDMSNYRVSIPILNDNISNMPPISSFHWLSHVITNGCKLEVEYENINDKNNLIEYDENNFNASYLLKKSIKEKIILKIQVGLSQLSKEESQNCSNMSLISETLTQCGFKIKCGERCTSTKCNFLCKWLVIKNEYLFEEFNELQKYLNNNEDNYFKSEIFVQVEIIEKTKLTPQQFEIISNKIRHK